MPRRPSNGATMRFFASVALVFSMAASACAALASAASRSARVLVLFFWSSRARSRLRLVSFAVASLAREQGALGGGVHLDEDVARFHERAGFERDARDAAFDFGAERDALETFERAHGVQGGAPFLCDRRRGGDGGRRGLAGGHCSFGLPYFVKLVAENSREHREGDENRDEDAQFHEVKGKLCIPRRSGKQAGDTKFTCASRDSLFGPLCL